MSRQSAIPTLEGVTNSIIAHLCSLNNSDAAIMAEDIALASKYYSESGDDTNLVNAVEVAISSLDAIGEDVFVYTQALAYHDKPFCA